jgi:isopentenyl-diphosphate delta-isomerase
MPNLIDVLSERGLRTGEVLSRAEVHRQGKIHRAIHLYLFNTKNELLLQRRSLTVDNFPGVFSISVLGHINAGEFSTATVRREIEEELGIDTADLKIEFLFSYFSQAVLSETYIDRQFNDVYVTRADIDPGQIHMDQAEVSEVRFVPFEHFRKMLTDPQSELAPVYTDECRDLTYFLDGWLPAVTDS